MNHDERVSIRFVLEKLVDQIDKTNPVDDHGHNFKMNKAFLDAKSLLEEPRDYRVCYYHTSKPTDRTSYPMQEPLLTYAEAEKEVAQQRAKGWAVAWIITRDGQAAYVSSFRQRRTSSD